MFGNLYLLPPRNSHFPSRNFINLATKARIKLGHKGDVKYRDPRVRPALLSFASQSYVRVNKRCRANRVRSRKEALRWRNHRGFEAREIRPERVKPAEWCSQLQSNACRSTAPRHPWKGRNVARSKEPLTFARVAEPLDFTMTFSRAEIERKRVCSETGNWYSFCYAQKLNRN